MRWYWKVSIGLSLFLMLVIILNIGLNLWIKFQLPKIINSKNDSSYSITYKSLEVSLLNSNILAKQVVIVPKATLKATLNKSGIYAKVYAIEVKDFKILSLLFNDKIKAKSITINQPKLVLYKKSEYAINHSKSIRESVVAPFEKIISVPNIFMRHGDLKIVYVKTNKAILSVQNINFQLDGVVITDNILKNKIPFQFRNYTLSCDSLYYRPNAFYHIRTKNITTTKTDVKVNSFEMIPEYSRRAFVSKIPKERDLYTLFCDTISVTKIDWGFKADDFFFHTNVMSLNHVSANIYRSKEPVDDLDKKFLYNKLLRDLKFDLKVDTLKIRHSIVVYEEEKSFDVGAGKLSFGQFNLTAHHISSGFKKQKLPEVTIQVKCQFMNSSPLNVDWKFNVMDKSDGFNIEGTLTNFDVERMAPFSKPYMNIETKGVMDEVHFSFTGNDKRNVGELAVKYDDLKFIIYKKDDRKKKNKLLTFVAKIFVKKDTKGKIKDAHIEVDRIPEKSFYNLLWRSVAEGLKKILV